MQTVTESKQLNIPVFTIFSVFCLVLVFLAVLLLTGNAKDLPPIKQASDVAIMDAFDSHLQNAMDDAETAAHNVPKRFWLPEDAKKGPVPNPENFGKTDDPTTLQWLLDDAQKLLDGDETLFSTDTVLKPSTEVTYYLDESIFAVTWKQIMNGCVFTISEIKVSDPSQFRRHLEGGVFDGPDLSTPTLMSRAVNAVVGSAADHYRGRKAGIIVYDGKVQRIDAPHQVDVCYIDRQGNLHFSYAGDLLDLESAQTFVDDHNISFSMAFGPILIDNGVRRDVEYYRLGEIWDEYARAALCQMGELHYLVITANSERGYPKHLTIQEFTKHVETFGCEKAYALDGGNTGSIVMNGQLINRTTFGYERLQGDIIYFCSAIPDHNTTGNQ